MRSIPFLLPELAFRVIIQLFSLTKRMVNMKTKTPTRDARATRAALLRAGLELFSQRGFEGATTDAIARRAGINKAMINYHFGGKKRLYEAILIDGLGRVADRLGELLACGLPADELLRAVLDALTELHVERPTLAALIVREATSGGRHLSASTLPVFSRVFEMVREVIDRGVRDGLFREVDPLLTHLSLVGSIVFFHASTSLRERLIREGHFSIPDAPTPERFTAHLKDLFERGLAAEHKAQES